MSEASLVQFDDPPRGAPGSDGQPATERIAATLESAGIDAPRSLYDEALVYAREGHLGQAQARLQMLLCLDPDDADGLLLLAKVHAAQGRPAEALGRLDAATSAGGLAPAGLREQLEAAIRGERAREEEHRARVVAREQGEIRSLRNETRNLRSEQVRLETEVTASLVRERNWKYAALVGSLAATFAIVVVTVASGPRAPAADPSVAAADVAETSGAPGAPVAHVVSPPAAAEAEGAAAGGSPSPWPSGMQAPSSAPGKSLSAAAKNAAKAAAAPSAPTADEPTAGGREHVVAGGDTLGRLAARYYGDASRWEEIAAANRGVLKNDTALSLGMKLRIP